MVLLICWSDAYLSDFYFIEGTALEPKTFGRDFAAGWGPLDGSAVFDKIGVKTSPYDTRPNMDEKWSEEELQPTSTGDYVFANAFKGTIFVSGGNNPGLPQFSASTGGSNTLGFGCK